MTPFRRPSVRYGKTPEPETPYQRAAQVWDDRIGSARVQARNWRLIAFGNLALAAGVAAALVWQSLSGTIVPWVVQVDRFGAAQAVAPAIADYRPTDPQIAWHLARFIEEVRSITADPVIIRQNWLQAYEFVTDKGALALNDYARANDPFGKVGRVQVATDVSSVIRASGRVLPRRMDGAPLREWRARRHRTLDRHSDHRGRAPARRRAPAQKSARRLCPCHQLVEGARLMRLKSLSTILLSSCSLAACATFKPPAIDYDRDYAPAALNADPPQPVKVVALRTPLPLPGQLKPLPTRKPAPEPKDPAVRVATANEAARVQPTRDGYINAVQVYPFTEGALYQVYTAPGQVTDIALQESEQLVGSGPVAAGDTVRWIIGDTESGAGPSRKVHILAKPTRPDLMTNLVINTDRRTYLLELRSTEKTYMASVSWQYPQDQLIALRRQNAEAQAAVPIQSGIDITRLRFRYAIEGDDAPWRPTQVFDDGTKVYIEFPRGIAQGEMPPLFVIGPRRRRRARQLSSAPELLHCRPALCGGGTASRGR